MKTIVSVLSFSCLMLVACQEEQHNTPSTPEAPKDTIVIHQNDVLTLDILSAEEQAGLTPQKVLDRLKQGNHDFIEDNLTIRNNTARVRRASLGQYPKAVILSCLDSRVPVEDVFHSGLGNLFVARVAGNIANEDIYGSLEFGCKVSGARLIVVLGHEYCGAVKSAIDGVKLGNITSVLNKIQPAVVTAGKNFSGEKKSSNALFVEAVCEANVKSVVEQIRAHSPILKAMEQQGEIKIVGAIYHMETGKVDFLEQK